MLIYQRPSLQLLSRLRRSWCMASIGSWVVLTIPLLLMPPYFVVLAILPLQLEAARLQRFRTHLPLHLFLHLSRRPVPGNSLLLQS